MKVNLNESFPHPDERLRNTHIIQFGISTWSEHESEEHQTESIRRAVYNADGIFSPHGSSEIPIEDMSLLIRACIERDKIPMDEISNILLEITNYLQRQKRLQQPDAGV